MFVESHLLKISGETKVMGMPDTPIGAYDMFAKTLLSSHFGIDLTGLEGTAVQARAVFFGGMSTRCSKPM